MKSVNNLESTELINFEKIFDNINYMTAIYKKPMSEKQQIASIVFGIMYMERKEQEKEIAYAN